ncbi:MAG: sigma 54-interacting transcriptional regulator, partial [Bacillota bacterium]|nr:sigma 54-interacting transcriptional regulator [Bacillota bacterium]
MDQILSIKKVQDKITSALASNSAESDSMRKLLTEIYDDLEVFHRQGIDFKDVVEVLDESVFIADKNGDVLYVNPAYEKNTGIEYDEIVGRNVYDIVKEGKLFSGGATIEVLKQKKKTFRLSTILKTKPHQMGYAIGVPLMNGNELEQVVVSSRPLFTLRELNDDYQRFLSAITEQKNSNSKFSVYDPLTGSETSKARLVGSSASLQNVWNLVKQVASTDATVLITGESGTGKEVIADELYRLGLRSNKPFVKVNCASIPANLLESELFGYEKGAFSGANTSGKKGLFEMADGGTLLLDEIGDMPLNLQVKLLRAIQNKEITRVGGVTPIPLDIRFIASTNCDLLKKVSDGEFRQDLYYRLSDIPIHMPP